MTADLEWLSAGWCARKGGQYQGIRANLPDKQWLGMEHKNQGIIMFKLRFRFSEIQDIAARYYYPREEDELINRRTKILQAQYLTKNDLRDVCRWKSPRSAGHVQTNSERFVKEITRFSLTASDERARVQTLTILDGVSWPTASVILHLFHQDKYPILDFRALWSVNADMPNQYSFSYWWEYVQFTRWVSSKANVSMRVLDRVLWQYSKENQRNRRNAYP